MTRPLREGDTVFVPAPSDWMRSMSPAAVRIGVERLTGWGFTVRLGEHVAAGGVLGVATVEERLADLEQALDDPSVGLVLPVYGGYNANDLLPGLDADRIRRSGAAWCGYSDTTALLVAVRAAGVPCLHGPSFSVLCDPHVLPETGESFLRAVRGESGYTMTAPTSYADDLWFLTPDAQGRDLYPSGGWRGHRAGVVEASATGGNLETLLALAGTPYQLDAAGSILLVENAMGTSDRAFVRDLTHLAQMGGLADIAGLVVGSFPRGSAFVDLDLLGDVVDRLLGDRDIPVLLNAAFSHVDPILTLPLGPRLCLDTRTTPGITVLEPLSGTHEPIRLHHGGPS